MSLRYLKGMARKHVDARLFNGFSFVREDLRSKMFVNFNNDTTCV